ncbi:MAG: transporter [Rhodobacteraceae bacterium]|nr:MAG: transporter [Paracoccaceae bacterium]
MQRKLKTWYLVATIAGIPFMPLGASAVTLQEALIEAYQSNPSLEISRASLRSQDESVVQAGAGKRPSVSLSGVTAYTADIDALSDPANTLRASLDARLVVFDGGRTADAVNAAAYMVYASRENLKASDQSVLLSAATAYLDVRRDQKFLALAQNDVTVIEQQVKAMQDRFAVGAVTRTDVALVEARLAATKTSLAASSGRLALSKEIYRAIVGGEPVNLQAPPALPRLPNSLAEAESIAMREHPSILATRFAEKAAEYDIARARAARLGTVTLGGAMEYTNVPGLLDRVENTQATVSLSGQIPIYNGGVMSSSIRSAAQILESRKATTQNVMRQIRQGTASSWANIRVGRASIVAANLQIEASQIAYNAIKEETRLGSRTTLDLLDAEQDLLAARSNLASAQRDEYVAALNLLSSMGLLTVENLDLGIPVYDPQVNFDAVTSKTSTPFSGSSILDAIGDRWK